MPPKKVRNAKADTLKEKECSNFTEESGLEKLWDDDEDFSVVIDQSVIVGVQEHAYSDPLNEIIGHLGGTWDEKENILKITQYCATCREIPTISPVSVEGSPTDQLSASIRFDELGLIYAGWYHSHPSIKPLPSQKDTGMQSELQAQVSYAIGLICSPYMDTEESEVCYFNVFRTRIKGKKIQAIKVQYNIRNDSYLNLKTLNEIQKTSQTILKENEETQEIFEKKCEQDNRSKYFVKSQFNGFLTNFFQNSVLQNIIGLQQDVVVLDSKIEKTKKYLEQKKNNPNNSKGKEKEELNGEDLWLQFNAIDSDDESSDENEEKEETKKTKKPLAAAKKKAAVPKTKKRAAPKKQVTTTKRRKLNPK